MTNFGSTRFNGGLSLAANLLGKPGKMDVHGDMVQDLYDAGRLAEIHDYCRCDVLDTYFVFLRSRVLFGQLTLEAEQQIIAETKPGWRQKADQVAAYRMYLDHWGDWPNPWEKRIRDWGLGIRRAWFPTEAHRPQPVGLVVFNP